MKLWSILNPHGYDLAPSAPSSAPTLVQKPTVRAHTVESFKSNRVRIVRRRPCSSRLTASGLPKRCCRHSNPAIRLLGSCAVRQVVCCCELGLQAVMGGCACTLWVRGELGRNGGARGAAVVAGSKWRRAPWFWEIAGQYTYAASQRRSCSSPCKMRCGIMPWS